MAITVATALSAGAASKLGPGSNLRFNSSLASVVGDFMSATVTITGTAFTILQTPRALLPASGGPQANLLFVSPFQDTWGFALGTPIDVTVRCQHANGVTYDGPTLFNWQWDPTAALAGLIAYWSPSGALGLTRLFQNAP